jgi:hypothetical protein
MQTELLIARASKTQHGFSDIQKVGQEVTAMCAAKDSLKIAEKLLASNVHQAHMLATDILGRLAAQSSKAFKLLRNAISQDPDWRVDESDYARKSVGNAIRDISHKHAALVKTELDVGT